VEPCTDKYVQSAPVGSFTPNAMGLYDMLGNVFEWTEDCWADDYNGAPIDGSARVDTDCAEHESRGGSWFTQPDFVRAAYRNRFPSAYSSTSVGFRLVREIPK
jgi:formylglycine-generating enzyme required for sulfatase activity